jgi:hypothetical protein
MEQYTWRSLLYLYSIEIQEKKLGALGKPEFCQPINSSLFLGSFHLHKKPGRRGEGRGGERREGEEMFQISTPNFFYKGVTFPSGPKTEFL